MFIIVGMKHPLVALKYAVAVFFITEKMCDQQMIIINNYPGVVMMPLYKNRQKSVYSTVFSSSILQMSLKGAVLEWRLFAAPDLPTPDCSYAPHSIHFEIHTQIATLNSFSLATTKMPDKNDETTVLKECWVSVFTLVLFLLCKANLLWHWWNTRLG